MVAKDGWKLTEVGPVPEDWEVCCLSDHFRIYAGGDVPKHSVSPHRSATHPHPIFANALQNRGLYGFTAERRAKSDCLTITARGFIGHAEYRNEDFFPIVRLLVLEPFGLLDARFTSFAVNERVSFALESTGVPQLTAPQVGRYVIAAPQISEQREISTVLSDADAAIESLDALIAKKRDVKQAAMQQLLTGRTRLPGFTADWKEVRLGDLGKCLRGVSYKGNSDLSDGDTPTTVRLLRSNNVQNSLIQFNDVQYVNHGCVSDEQILRRNDIVICMANGSKVLVGKTGLYKDSQDTRYTFGAFMGCFRSSSDQAHAIFVRYLFLTKQYQDYISNLLAGSSINNLTPKSIESFLFNVPPLKEQEAIAEALTVMDDELKALTQQVSKLRMVKEGMMQDLLTGKVRLV